MNRFLSCLLLIFNRHWWNRKLQIYHCTGSIQRDIRNSFQERSTIKTANPVWWFLSTHFGQFLPSNWCDGWRTRQPGQTFWLNWTTVTWLTRLAAIQASAVSRRSRGHQHTTCLVNYYWSAQARAWRLTHNHFHYSNFLPTRRNDGKLSQSWDTCRWQWQFPKSHTLVPR